MSVVNFNKKRKEKAKSDKQQKASENRIAFGRTKSQKQLEKSNREKDTAHIQSHKRDTVDDTKTSEKLTPEPETDKIT